MNNYADYIKNHVTVADACRAYGIRVNSAGFASCPFHREKTASMKIYPGTRGFCCFGCGKTGDVIDFVGGLYDLNFMEAVIKINDDFSLGLPIGRKIGAYRRARLAASTQAKMREKDAKNRRLDALEHDYDYALTMYVRLERIVERFKPKSADDVPNARYLWASSLMPEFADDMDATQYEIYKLTKQ